MSDTGEGLPTTRDLEAARLEHEINGGWLLDLGDGLYLATDDEGLVWDLRGNMPASYWTALEFAGYDETRMQRDE